MNRAVSAWLGCLAAAFFATGSLAIAQESKPPTQSEITQEKSDSEVAAAYKEEATKLREKAGSHRALAKHYRARGAGTLNYSQIAKHCDKLSLFYEDAAKEADAVALALGAK